MKLIIECDTDGATYVYEESEKHFRKTEPYRKHRLSKRELESVANHCLVSPGEYFVIPLVYS